MVMNPLIAEEQQEYGNSKTIAAHFPWNRLHCPDAGAPTPYLNLRLASAAGLLWWHYDRSEDMPSVRLTCALFIQMSRRSATIIVCLVGAAAWAFVAFATFTSGSDAATKGLDQGAGLLVTALFLVTSAPALALALLGRAPIAALTLALAFPVAFAAVFIAAIIAFA